MQQTRIEQGRSYYIKFITKYPTVKHLADASLDDIMKQWEGLGYYTRARNLHKAAQYISDHLQGIFPVDYNSLIKLPGVGPYSAAAISSFAYGHHHVVVDGNVKRLIARFEGITTSIDDASTHEQIRNIAEHYMKPVDAAEFNQAIMNFGALICKPRPLCNICPLAKKCFAYQHQLVSSLPVRTKKNPNKLRFFHFLFVFHNNKLLLKRQEEKDIWKGLYAPLRIESKSTRAPSATQINELLKSVIGHARAQHAGKSEVYRQLLSHQTIAGRYHLINLSLAPGKLTEPFVWLSWKDIARVGKPRMIVEMLADTSAKKTKHTN
jgi:A/G-specific adenine glycosylase